MDASRHGPSRDAKREAPQCSICYEPLLSHLSETECGHVFHTRCLLRSLSLRNGQEGKCPLCRTVLLPFFPDPPALDDLLPRSPTVRETARPLPSSPPPASPIPPGSPSAPRPKRPAYLRFLCARTTS